MRYAVALAVLFGIGAASDQPDAGRYQLVRLGDLRADQFLLDSRTGKIWRMTCSTRTENGCQAYSWQREEVQQ